MPAYTYLSDNEIRNWSSVPEDKECNDLLQELRMLSEENWIIEVRTFQPQKKWWRRKLPLPIKSYTLYYVTDGGIEAQVLNLCTNNSESGSVFSYSGRSDVMNYMMGLINGLTR